MKKNKKGQDDIEILDFETDETSSIEDVEIEEKDNIFVKIKDKWLSLNSRSRTIIIVVSVVVILAIISLILFFVMNKKDTSNKKKQVIVAKDNYRYEDGVLYFVVNHKDIGSYTCKNKDKNLCYVAFETNDDEFDETNYTDQEPVRSKIIKNKYVFIYDNAKKNQEKVILYDIKKQKDIATYKSIKTYDLNEDNLVFIKDKDDKYGLIKFSANNMKTRIDFDYDYLGVITEDKSSDEQKIVAELDHGSFLIDYNGEKLTKTFNGAIKNYNANYVKTKDATKKYSLFNYEGEKKDEDLNYIDLLDNYYIAVDSENKIKVYDYDKTKFNEEGIVLYNNDYVKEIDEDNDAKYAYTYSLENSNLVIHVNNDGKDEVTTINLFEGLASKNYKYINYFNGSIYFYSDEEKTNLINSYKCNNKNNITSADAKLETCTIASDTNEDNDDTNNIAQPASIIPIYNNRYVFIKDKDIVNLVDLVDEKVMGTYAAVNSYSDATKTDYYIENTDNKYIFARNKAGKYGLLKLSGNTIVSQYNFEYERLQKLGNGILAFKDGKSYILDFNGNKVTADYAGLIRNYTDKYVKVLSDNKYYVYDYKGQLVFEDGYKYVELYDGYVGLVDDSNKLSVNDYEGNLLINSILKLSSTTYYKPKEGYVVAFAMRKDGEKLIITCATSQDTKVGNAKDFIYNLTTREKVN